jgi:nucleotide-binding universal stress UspA family protein
MTSEIRRIAVPTDFSLESEKAVAYAAALARRMGSALYLVHVLKDLAGYHEARERLAMLASRLAIGTRRFALDVRTGEPAESIAEAAERYGADLVVMTTHGRTGLAHMVSGSVAEEVIRRADCPVLVLRDSGTIRFHRPVPVVEIENRQLEGAA